MSWGGLETGPQTLIQYPEIRIPFCIMLAQTSSQATVTRLLYTSKRPVLQRCSLPAAGQQSHHHQSFCCFTLSGWRSEAGCWRTLQTPWRVRRPSHGQQLREQGRQIAGRIPGGYRCGKNIHETSGTECMSLSASSCSLA